MANIFSLYGSVFIDNEKANKAIDETTKKGKEGSTSLGQTIGNIGGSILKVGSAVASGATAVVGGLTAMTGKTSEYAGSILDASRKTSISTDMLQQLKYAGEQSGVSFEDLTGSATKFNKIFSDAATGNKANIQTFKDLGIAIKDSSGNARSSSDVYNDVILKLAEMGDTAEANALGNDIFGKSFANLKPLLAEGAGGIEAFKQQASDLGIVMSESAIVAGDNFGDTIDSLKAAFGGIFNQLMGSLIPILQPIIDGIIANMPKISAFLGQLTPIFTNLMSSLIPPLMQLAEQLFPIILDLINQLLPPILEIITMLLPIFTELLAIILPPLIQIIQALLPAIIPIIKALIPILTPLLDVLSWLITTILMPIINVITSIINVISKGLVGAIKALTPVVSGIATIFKDVFGGLFNIVKVPINFIIDGLNKFIEMINKIKIPDWVPAVGGKGINLPLIKKLRVGLEYVSQNEMPAILHKGEGVLTAEENKQYQESKRNKNQEVATVFNDNKIVVEKMEVRDESDIKRIAEELFYLQKKREA